MGSAASLTYTPAGECITLGKNGIDPGTATYSADPAPAGILWLLNGDQWNFTDLDAEAPVFAAPLSNVAPGAHTLTAQPTNEDVLPVGEPTSIRLNVCAPPVRLAPQPRAVPEREPKITLVTEEPDKLRIGSVSPKRMRRGKVSTFRLVIRNDTDRGATFFTTSLSNGGLARRTVRIAPGSRFIIRRRVRAGRRASSVGVRWNVVKPDTETFSFWTRTVRVRVLR